MKRRQRSFEWPTFVLVAFAHAGWFAAGFWLWPVAPWAALAVMTVMVTLHSSLQHEVLHGHPTGNRHVNEALVFLPLGLFYPYRRFKATHLAHHRDERLTDPYDDPESKYLALRDWLKLPGWFQSVIRVNNTLLGRLTIGPLIAVTFFLISEVRLARQSRKVRLAWLLHGIGMVPVVVLVVGVFGMPFWLYALVPAYFGLSLLTLRTFCEHRWAEDPAGRTIIVEKTLLSVLYLNNNLHVVHHSQPAVAWYRLPALYRARRDHWRSINGGYVFPSYLAIAKAYLLKAKEPVVHPAWRRDEEPAATEAGRQTASAGLDFGAGAGKRAAK